MARSRLWDLYQNHKFHLFDITESTALTSFLDRRDALLGLGGAISGLRAPRQVLSPQYAFQSITAPSLTLDYEEMKSGTNPFKRHVPTDAEVDPLTLTRGVFIGDSDFYDWIITAVYGRSVYRRKLMLVQLFNPPPTFDVGALGTINPTVSWVQLVGGLVTTTAESEVAGGAAKALSSAAAAAAVASTFAAGLGAQAASNAINSGLNSTVLGLTPADILAAVTARVWVLHDCVPASYKSTSDFDANSADIGLQELEIRMERFEEFTMDTKPITTPLGSTIAGAVLNGLT
jgi:phage tail-like protein